MSVGKASRGKKSPINEGLGNQGRHEKELKPSQESPSKGGVRKTTTSVITLVPIIILLLFSFAVYFNALFGGFVYDDLHQIANNRWIRDSGNIPEIFSKSVWGFQSGLSTSNYYRPLMHIVYMLNYHLFGLKPWGFHLVNILLHCGVSVLVFLVIRRLLTEQGATTSSEYLSPPFIAAMLFASHPIHTEAVTWIGGLPDVAFTFFYLLSFYLYILLRDGAKRGYLLPLSVLSFLVAILFKEPALTLLIMLIAYDCLWKKSDETISSGIKRYIPYVVVSGIYFLLRYFALRSVARIEFYSGLSTYQSIINVFPFFKEYLTSLFWPFDLNLWHTFHPIRSLFEEEGMISMGVSIIFLILVAQAYRKNKVVLFGLLVLIVPLLPVLYIKGISQKPFAERYLYLSSAGFVFLLSIAASWTKENFPRAVRGIAIIVIAIVGLYTVVTVGRNNVWKDDFTLWSHTVKKSPDSAVAHNNLGAAYVSKGQLDMAIAEFQTALRLNPDYADARSNLGKVNSSNHLDMAIQQYQTALRLKRDDAEAHFNLGAAYASKGQFDTAIAEYQAALRLNPDHAKAHNNLGIAYAAKGQLNMAIAEFQIVLRMTPDDSATHYNLGLAYSSKGQVDAAIQQYQTALRLKPDYAEAHFNLGLIYLSNGSSDKARTEFELGLAIKPDDYRARQVLNSIISR